jgi:hypothetical protein
VQAELLPLEGAVNDLAGGLDDLPELSEDLRLLPGEGELKEPPLVTLGPLKDLRSLGEDT